MSLVTQILKVMFLDLLQAFLEIFLVILVD